MSAQFESTLYLYVILYVELPQKYDLLIMQIVGTVYVGNLRFQCTTICFDLLTRIVSLTNCFNNSPITPK